MSVILPICVVNTAVCCLSFRMFSFDNRSYSLFEKKFVAGYQFMKVERNGADTVYRIAWKDVVLILENPIVKTLKIR